MQKRLVELASGRVVTDVPAIEFSVSRIELEVYEGIDGEGTFEINSTNQIPAEGRIYTSDPRMECLTGKLQGEKTTVQYQFHSEGLTEGDIRKGEFYVICSQGEYNLSFVVVIRRNQALFGTRQIQSLADVTALAREHWELARGFFYTDGFQQLLKGEERLLYQGLATGQQTDRSFEEFMLALRQKSLVRITASQTSFSYSRMKDTVQTGVQLKKSTWGFVDLEVSSDVPFLIPQKHRIGMEDFCGSEYTLVFLIDPDLMHAGRNYGTITIRDMRQEIRLSVCASGEDAEGRNQVRAAMRREMVQLASLYVDYRIGKIGTGKWASESCIHLDHLIEGGEHTDWYRLIKAQALLTNGQKQEAEWILGEFKRKCRDRKSAVYGYYLYLCTLMEHEELYISRLIEEMEQIYREHRENTLLFWCLLMTKEDFIQDHHKKLRALERHMEQGSESPLLYAEAYCLLKKEPYLLHYFGAFELKILNWARKQKALTEDLAEQFFGAFSENCPYQRSILLLFESCCMQWPDEKRLSVFLAYLIRNQKYGRRFFPWYEKGVEQKLRITGLYEAYVMSMDPREVQEMPQIILMYFKYNNQLGYRQKAVLYVNIIANRHRQPEIYEQYKESMHAFAMAQMEQGHMDDNLAVIYQDVLAEMPVGQAEAEHLVRILFVHKLTCMEPRITRVIVMQEPLQQAAVIPVRGQTAYFPLYTNAYRIFYEDASGNRYSGDMDVQMEKLMYPGRYIRRCLQYVPDALPYLLYYFSGRTSSACFTEEDVPLFERVMEHPAVDRHYKALLAPRFLLLLQELDQGEKIKHVLSYIDPAALKQEDRCRIIQLCVEEQIDDVAWDYAGTYGLDGLDASVKVRLLDARVRERSDGQPEEKRLTDLCTELFFEGSYSERILGYLVCCFRSSTRRMAALWKAAHDCGLETRSLEERILTQMLYTTEYIDCAEEIYDSYKEQGRRLVCQAYLTYFSYGVFVRNMVPPEHLYRELLAWYKEDADMNSVCCMELLSYLSRHVYLQERESAVTEALLQRLLAEERYFAFYMDLQTDLLNRYLLTDQTFVEYRGQPDARMILHYRYETEEGAYRTEEMAEEYDGIYVSRFLLFAGEALQYYISVQQEEDEKMLTSGRVSSQDLCGDEKKGRYGRINRMIYDVRTGNEAEFAGQAEAYRWLEKKVEETFTVIE